MRIRDVAKLAGLSTTTVSNVVNGRASVAESIRHKVETILRESGYDKNEHAVALRRLRAAVSPPGQVRHPAPNPDPGDAWSAAGKDIPNHNAALSGPDAEQLRCAIPGDRVDFIYQANAISGIVDALMPDRSGIWIWCDGLGRRFIPVGRPDISDIQPENTDEPTRSSRTGRKLSTGFPGYFT